MPESHERHKGEKDVVSRQNSAGGNYDIPHFDSDISCVSIDDHRLNATPDGSSNIKDDISHCKDFSEDDSNALEAVLNASKGSLLNQTESGKLQDVSFLHSDINVNTTKEASDEEDEIAHGIRSAVSIGKELSLLGGTASFTDGRSLRRSEENCSLQQRGLSISVVDQKAADIVYDTLQLINGLLQLEGEIPQRERSTVDAGIEEPQFTNLVTLGIERDSVLDKQSLFAIETQEVSNIRGHRAANNDGDISSLFHSGEISSLFHSAPLIFPETSDISLSMTTAPKTKIKSSRSPRRSSRLSDLETGITCDWGEITEINSTDSRGVNPPDSSLIDSTTRQFHIVVQTHPDGGWGWVVCLGAFLVQFIVLGMQNSAGIVYTELVKELKSPRGATAWVGSLATGIMFFLGPLATSLCERVGCRIVTICGGLICIAGLLLSSLVTTLLPLYLTYGLMFGSGTSLCYFPTIIVLSKYFKKRIAIVNGLVTAGSGVGTVVIGPGVQALFLHFGVANTFQIVAGIFSLVILCGVTFRPVPAKYSQYNNWTEGGEAKRLFDCSIFKNKGYVVWIASLATFQLGYFVPFVHLVRHAEDLGVSPTDASFLIGYLSVASTVGRLFFGKMADLSCVSRVRMYQMGVFAIGLCSFLVTLATGYGGLIAYAVSFGFFEASFILLIPLVTTDIVGAEKMSYALGSAFTVMAFPMFLGPPIAGWMYDIFGDYAGAFYSCGGISFLAAFLMFFVPRMSQQSSRESNQRLPANLLKIKKPSHHYEVMQVLSACLWKDKQASRTSSNVQYSVIITTEQVESV